MNKSLVAFVAAVFMFTAVYGFASPKFYPDDPISTETDSQDASSAQPWEIDLVYDLMENMFSKPGDPVMNIRAKDINTIDEVPDSNWFVNRIGSHPMTASEISKGPNMSGGPAAGKWVVSSAKSDGITPGFTIKDSAGQRWFIKFDPLCCYGMATGTEVAVTKLFWALGYHVPENYVSVLHREDLTVSPTATYKPPGGSKKRKMDLHDVDKLLKQAFRDPDGTYRIIASKALDGKPLGGFRFYDTRPDDPNDVIPHEHRRELRGYGVFAAWLNHVDSKAINSLDTLITENGRSVVRHHLLDFGSTLGSASVFPREPWEGYEYLFEGGHQIATGIVTLGLKPRPWRSADYYYDPAIGRFPKDNRNFNPEEWKPRAPNPAFLRSRADDKFWAARKLAALDDDLIRAAVHTGKFPSESGEKFLVQALIDRRDAIVRTYLTGVNPIVDPEVNGTNLTFKNAAVDAGFAAAPSGYRASWSEFNNETKTSSPIGETRSSNTSVPLPDRIHTRDGSIVRVEISATGGANPSWSIPVNAYFRRTGDSWKLVGFERLP